MTRNVTVLAAAFLVACSGSKDTNTNETGSPTDTTDTNQCSNSVTARFPASGDEDVYYRTPIRFTLTAEEDDATVAVTDASGAAVSGSTTVEGTLVSWTGDDGFAPSTAYTAVLTYSCGDDTIAFTTSTTGAPVGDGSSLVGNVYALDIADGQWVQPPGVGGLLASQLGDTQILVSPQDVTAADITMIGGIGSAGAQDECSPTIPFPAANFSDPFFSIDAPELPLSIAGITINIKNLSLSGAFAPDGSRIQGATLGGQVDTSALGAAFGLGTDPDSVCQLVSTFGVSCEDCPDGSGTYCLTVYVDNVGADKVAGGTLVEITQDDIDANPNCATGT